jgi:hypothetical protein
MQLGSEARELTVYQFSNGVGAFPAVGNDPTVKCASANAVTDYSNRLPPADHFPMSSFQTSEFATM